MSTSKALLIFKVKLNDVINDIIKIVREVERGSEENLKIGVDKTLT